METLRNKRKLAAVTREIQEENPRNGQSRNTSVPRVNEDYITQLSEEIEGRVTKKLSQEYSRTKSRILGALSKLDEFLLNQQIRTHSGTVPETFRNTNVDNQGTNEDDSQSDLHPEAGLFRSQTTQNSGPEVGPYSCLRFGGQFCRFRRETSFFEQFLGADTNFRSVSSRIDQHTIILRLSGIEYLILDHRIPFCDQRPLLQSEYNF